MTKGQWLGLFLGIAMIAAAAGAWMIRGVHERDATGKIVITIRPTLEESDGWVPLSEGEVRTPSDAEVTLEFAVKHPLPRSPGERRRMSIIVETTSVWCVVRPDPPKSLSIDTMKPEVRDAALRTLEESVNTPATLDRLADEVMRRTGNTLQSKAVRRAGQSVEIDPELKWGAWLLAMGGIGVCVLSVKGGLPPW